MSIFVNVCVYVNICKGMSLGMFVGICLDMS